MKALIMEGPGNFHAERVDDPTPDGRDVIVKVDGCGICGTDMHLLDGDLPFGSYPVVPGHEFAGTIVAVGSKVAGVSNGDYVAVHPSVVCGHCRYCRSGRSNLCDNIRGLGTSLDGGCAEFVRVPEANVFRTPSGVTDFSVALTEPAACAVHGFDVLGLQLGQSYLIYGAGTMGLLLVQLARHGGCESVAVVDTNPDRHRRALAFGADEVATSPQELTQSSLWDIVIDATGAVAAIEDGLTRVDKGGTFLQFGVAPTQSTARWSPYKIYNEEITVVGSMSLLNSFGRALSLCATGEVIDAKAMVTHRFALEDYSAAVETFKSGDGLKIQVAPSGI